MSPAINRSVIDGPNILTTLSAIVNLYLVKENPVEIALSHIALICGGDFSFPAGIS
jgi:hypothetical protein